MPRHFDSKEECDRIIDELTDPKMSDDEMMDVMMGALDDRGGIVTASLLAVRRAAMVLEEELSGNTGNEVHDAHTIGAMREPAAQMNLAIEKMLDAVKEIAWFSATCGCRQCRHDDKMRAAKFN